VLKKYLVAALGFAGILLPAGNINLIENGSFEDKADKLYHFNATRKLDDGKTLIKAAAEEVAYGIAADKARTGARSLRFQSNIAAGGTAMDYVPKVPLKSGVKYIFTAYYFIKAGENPGKLRVSGRVVFFDKTGKTVKYLFPEAPATQNEWLSLKIEFYPPVGAEAAAFTLWSDGGARTIWWDDISLEETSAEKATSAYSYQAKIAEISDMLVWKNTPNVKTPYKGIPENLAAGQLELSCAVNESEPFQLVLTPGKDLSDISLDFTDLKNNTGASIGKQNISCKSVAFINIKEADNPSIVGMNADPLMPEKTVSLKTGVNSPFWIVINVPEKTAPGIYEGFIKIRKGENEISALPVSLKVRSFSIPTVPFLKAAFYARSFPSQMGKFDHRSPDETCEDVFENLKNHRISGNQGYGVPVPKYEIHNNILEITDWSPVDNFMSQKINKYSMNWFKMAPLGFYGDNSGWFDNKTALIFGKDIQTAEGRSVLTQYVKLLSAHLKEKGWFDKSCSYIWDEPPEPFLKSVSMLCDAIHGGDKDFNVFITRKITAELKGKVNTWCLPFGPGYIDMDEIKDSRVRGEKCWIYNWPVHIDDYEYIQNRLFPWLAYMIDAEGVLLWQILHANGGNPWTELNTTYANGAATLLYPHPSGMGPYIDSQRFAIVKEAIDDYDYFKILENKIDSLKRGWGRPRVKEIISALIYKPPFDYINDSSLLYHIRDEIADEIESMDKKPLLLVQTIPSDNSSTVLNEVQINGICEPGAKIKINDEAVTTAGIGTFLRKITLKSTGKNLIKIEAENNGEKKTVYRTITLEKDPQLGTLKKLLAKAASLNVNVEACTVIYDAASNSKEYSVKQKSEVAATVTVCQKKIIQAELDGEAKNVKNKLYTAFFSRARWAGEHGFFEKAEHYLKEGGRINPDKDLSHGSCSIEVVKKDGHFGFILKNSVIEIIILESGARILDFKVNGVSCLRQGNPNDYPEEVRADMKKCIEAVELKFRPNLGGYEDAGMEQMAVSYADWEISVVDLLPDKISISAEITFPGDKFRLCRLMTIVKDDPRMEVKYTIKNIQPGGFKSDDPHAYDFPWRGHADIAIGGNPEGNILVIPASEKLKCLEFSAKNPIFYEVKTLPLTGRYAGSFSPVEKTGFAQILDDKIKHLYIWFQSAANNHGSVLVYTIEPNKSIGVKPFIIEPGKEVSFTNYFAGLNDIKTEDDFKKQVEKYKDKPFVK
jgi:hypothetical protein